MNRVVVFLLSLLLIQGCSSYIPPEQAASLPEILYGPSALVLMDQEATVIGVNGSMTKITKMGEGVITHFYVKDTQTFFMVDSSSFNTLWEWEKQNNQLICVMPKIQPKRVLNRMMESYEVSDDKQFCLIKYWTELTINEKTLCTYYLFSMKNQKEIAFPVTSQEIVSDAWFEVGETDRFYYITREKEKMYSQKKVYWWDTKTNESKLLTTFESEEYAYSKNGRWVVVMEDNKLIRYTLDTGTKEIIKENVIEVRFSYIGKQPYLFLCEYGTNSTPVCTYMTPEKEWRSFSFYAFDDIENFEIAEDNHVVFLTQNQLTKMKSMYCWDSRDNQITRLYQAKSLKTDFKIFSYPITKGKVIHIQLTDEEKGKITILRNLTTKTTKIMNTYADKAKPLSNDGSIWYFWEQNAESTKLQLPFVFNWKEDKEYPVTLNNAKVLLPEGATNDGKYITITTYSSSKDLSSRMLEMPQCKEVTIPDVKIYQFITWLD